MCSLSCFPCSKVFCFRLTVRPSLAPTSWSGARPTFKIYPLWIHSSWDVEFSCCASPAVLAALCCRIDVASVLLVPVGTFCRYHKLYPLCSCGCVCEGCAASCHSVAIRGCTGYDFVVVTGTVVAACAFS